VRSSAEIIEQVCGEQERGASSRELTAEAYFFFSCCFQPRTLALFPSASASGTIPFFW
jgi:hypothetical protein